MLALIIILRRLTLILEPLLDELHLLAAHARNWRTETGIPRVAMVQGNVPHMLWLRSMSRWLISYCEAVNP